MKKKGVFVDCLEPEVEKFIFENPMIKEIIELLCKHFKNKNEQSHLLKLIKRLIEDEKRRLYKYFFELKFVEPKDDGKVENILFNKIQAILNKEGEVCGFKIHKTLITMFILARCRALQAALKRFLEVFRRGFFQKTEKRRFFWVFGSFCQPEKRDKRKTTSRQGRASRSRTPQPFDFRTTPADRAAHRGRRSVFSLVAWVFGFLALYCFVSR